MSVQTAIERARKTSEYELGDRMEMEDIEFHEKVRFGFRKIAGNLSEQNRVKLINVDNKSIEQVHEEIVGYVSKKIWKE
jgi:thymidylate kinase